MNSMLAKLNIKLSRVNRICRIIKMSMSINTMVGVNMIMAARKKIKKVHVKIGNLRKILVLLSIVYLLV